MERTVLIIGPNYFNFPQATKAAFEREGWNTSVDLYDTPVHPYTTLMKWRYKLSLNKERIRQRSKDKYNDHVLEVFRNTRPQLVFVMNGEPVFDSTLDAMRQESKVVVWLFDNRDRLPDALSHIDHSDLLLCYEQEDVDWYASQGKKAYFLPQACDTATYHPVECPKDIDILFIGNLYTSPKRMQTMQAVVEKFCGKYHIEVYGRYKPWYKGFFTWLTREHREIYKNDMVAPAKVNELYNRARVVLNIHQELQKDGANPRTFEIPGSGAWQICDYNPYIQKLFGPDEIGIYHDQEELFALIEKGLNQDMTACAQKARNKVLEQHTYDVRVREILKTLKLNDSPE